MGIHKTEIIPKLETLIRRVLTALIHHVKNATGFAVVGDLIVAQFVQAFNNKAEGHHQLARVLEVISIPLAVRHGSRMTEDHIKTLLEMSPALLDMPHSQIDNVILKFMTAVLTSSSGSMAIWMKNGRALIEKSWSGDNGLTLRLHGSLAQIGWGGWKMVALPGLVGRTGTLLSSDDAKDAIRLFALLTRDGKLSSAQVDMVWKARINKWVCDRLRAWSPSDDVRP